MFFLKVDTLTLKCVTFVTFVTLCRCAPRCTLVVISQQFAAILVLFVGRRYYLRPPSAAPLPLERRRLLARSLALKRLGAYGLLESAVAIRAAAAAGVRAARRSLRARSGAAAAVRTCRGVSRVIRELYGC